MNNLKYDLKEKKRGKKNYIRLVSAQWRIWMGTLPILEPSHFLFKWFKISTLKFKQKSFLKIINNYFLFFPSWVNYSSKFFFFFFFFNFQNWFQHFFCFFHWILLLISFWLFDYLGYRWYSAQTALLHPFLLASRKAVFLILFLLLFLHHFLALLVLALLVLALLLLLCVCHLVLIRFLYGFFLFVLLLNELPLSLTIVQILWCHVIMHVTY